MKRNMRQKNMQAYLFLSPFLIFITVLYILPAILAVLLLLSILTPLFAASAEGPGSMHAPVLASLAGGTDIRSRCTAVKDLLCRRNQGCDPHEEF